MPAGQSDVRAKTKARFDEVLKRYTNPPSEKKKAKQITDHSQEIIALQTLKKNLDLSKDIEDDEAILHNTYDPAQGSPRYTKNRRREREASEKTNINNSVSEEEPTLTGGKKKSKRKLPQLLPPVQNEEDHDRRADAEIDGKRTRKTRKGKSKSENDVGRKKEDTETEDDYLQAYQHQISQEDETAGKKMTRKKAAEKLTESQPLNNELEKKKKKVKSNKHDGDRRQTEEGNQIENIQDSAVEEFKEDTVKPKVKKKKKRKEVAVEEEQAEEKRSFDDSLVLGVYIHRTDKLKTDLMVSHPMVKVHVVDEVTGQYVKKEDSHRHVSSFYEQENIEHILPIITQPFDFKKHKNTVPEWEEQIIFNERFGYFLQEDDESPRVILFFEILDFISMEEARTNVSVDRHDRGFRKIAWAFLKLVGTNGVLNVDTKLRLQLYCSPPRAKKQPQTVEVFQWWSKYPRNKYASTLYVTVKGLKPPEHVDPSIRSMMALQQERGTTSYSELNTEMTNKTSTQILESKSEIIKWSRIPGQVCRIPNKPMHSFRGGQMGCFTLRFSHDGRALAAACADRDAFPIIIYEIPSGKVLASFNGHLSVVYDLCWSRDDNGLLTASSDGTVRVWNVERLQSFAHKTLPHPSFVYCAQFHPQTQSLVVTGGYDGVLRVWNVHVQDVNGQLLQEFDGHKTFINTLCFDPEGSKMFSADNSGLIIVWGTKVMPGSRRGLTSQWCIEREIKEADLNGISINSLEVHPNGRRLLIHAKDSVLRVMDLRILAVKKYIGATNYRERINSTFTPCGSFVFSGSEDGLAYVWNSETGDQVAVYSELCYTSALRAVAFHPHENMVAFSSFGQNQPIHLYLYDRKVAQMEVESLRGLSRSENLESKMGRNSSEVTAFQNTSVMSMDQFASTARVSLKMQRVKQKLDSVLEPHRSSPGVDIYEQGGMSYLGRSQEGLASYLPPPSLLSPHSKLQMSTSLSAQLIPQATLTSHSSGYSPAGQPIRRTPSLKHQKSLLDYEFSQQAETDFGQIHQTVVSLYEYRANRSDELSIRRGDVIHVLYKDNDSWWFGRLVSGQEGYFPASYVADEGSFDEELSSALEAQPSPLDQPEGVERATPVQLSAAISASGELKIISELDTDPEASSTVTKKKKKKVKRSEVPSDLPRVPSSDREMSSASSRRRRPLPRLGQANGAFEGEGQNQRD
ncbi:jouberin isoform X1 [Puntigrus tetrazona]|uniref:jouberin isoform X1 n=1 Tax=Puntigrus tetrazona TaxID=1606681 RepID=UPI001C8A4242|nr:jouberin isoform X1 [Puntigrus tetrazona]XP_043119226.1 jouberin isoform X1 [Puntigrus tetrazona]